MKHHSTHDKQFGGTTLGIIVGILLGLMVALGVSLYLANSGAPVQNRATNNAARIEPPADPSKAPDPNQSLYTKVPKMDDAKEGTDKKDGKESKEGADTKPVKDSGSAPVAATSSPPNVTPNTAAIATPASTPAASNKAADQDGIGKIAALVTPSKSADAASMPKAATAASGERYFVQAGAFASVPEAESMKAKLALLGVSMGLSPRDKDGQILQRVRTVPLAAADAEKLRNTLKANGIETSLVKVQ